MTAAFVGCPTKTSDDRGQSISIELAVRAALGAGRERIVRQIVTESIVLSAIGGLAGVLVSIAAVPGLTQLVPNSLPIAQQPSVDLHVLLSPAR